MKLKEIPIKEVHKKLLESTQVKPSNMLPKS
jgi:hypothetical protein